MAKKPKFQGFIDCVPTKTMQTKVKKDDRDLSALFRAAVNLADAGYKFSVRWSEYHDAYQVGLYGDSLTCDNPGWQLTAQHIDAEKALKLLLNTHEADDGAWQQGPQTDVSW